MRRMLLATLPLCLLLAGCDVLPYPRELEDTMLVRVLGVDWTGDGVSLTAADAPGEGETSEAQVLTATASTLEESRMALKQEGERSVSLTHVTQLVVGRESDLRAVLEGALEEKEVGQTATVWLAGEGTARELMEAVGGGAKRLTSIELNGGWEPPTILEALARLEEEGAVTLPVLVAGEKELEAVKRTVWKEGER